MSKFNFIITAILFGTIYTRQIGLIANHILTYEPPANNSSITTITFKNTSSCNTCICAAFMSQIDYVAINCYKGNNTCSLLTQLVNFTAIISFQNSFLYILSYTSMPLIPEVDSKSSSSVTTITLTSTASFTITTTSFMTAISASVGILTGTTKTTTTTTMLTVARTTSIITTTTMPTVATTTIRITTTTTMPTVATTTSRITTTTAYRTTTTTTQGGSGSCAFLIFFCS